MVLPWNLDSRFKDTSYFVLTARSDDMTTQEQTVILG